jgi:general secretion pathway protein G
MNITIRKHSQPKRAGRDAFTLVELILVMTILAILAGIVLPKITGRTEQARVTKAKQEIANFSTALGAYEVDTGSYPKGRNGLQALIQKPSGAQNWHGPYLENVSAAPLDPWGNPYIYECPGKHNPSGFDLSSMGPDGRVGGNDDVCNWDMSK